MFSQLWFFILVPGLPMGGLLLWTLATAKKREQQFRRPFDEMPRPAGYSLQKRTADIMDKFTEDLMLCLVGGVAIWSIWLSDKRLIWVALVLGLVYCSIFAFRAKGRIVTYWIPVSPVLVLPGWWVEGKGKGSVAVLNPKGLPSFLTGRPSIFPDRQFRAIHAQLEKRCRIDLTR